MLSITVRRRPRVQDVAAFCNAPSAIRRELPLNQPVDIEFTPSKTGNVDFVCGMNMLRGTIVVE